MLIINMNHSTRMPIWRGAGTGFRAYIEKNVINLINLSIHLYLPLESEGRLMKQMLIEVHRSERLLLL